MVELQLLDAEQQKGEKLIEKMACFTTDGDGDYGEFSVLVHNV